MDLVDSEGHRALAFVVAAQRQGYEMTCEEFDAYLAGPQRRRPVPGTPDRTAISTKLDRAFGIWSANNLAPILDAITKSLEIERREVPGTPEIPGESVREWLTRLGWLADNLGRVRATQLGVAMLAHLEQEDEEEEIPIGVVLEQGDKLATARVIQKIAELGQCSVIDPYFSIDSLLHVIQSTKVNRVLTGTHDSAKLSGLEAAVGAVEAERDFEIRKSEVFHDRFVIPEIGPVWLLGTSFTGLGKRLSLMVEMTDDAVSAAIRGEFEKAWEAAEPITAPSAEAEEKEKEE